MKGDQIAVQTDPGCLDGVEKESAREEEYRDEIRTANLAQLIAVVTVQKYADRVGLCTADRDELLAMLELPAQIDPPSPQERAQLPQNLPQLINLDLRDPNDQFTPERRQHGRRNGPW